MAVCREVVEKTLEDLEKEITCAICQEQYTDPKILPCLHCYCKQCIHRLAVQVGQGKPFSCPECRRDTFLPEGGEDELKSAFIINRLKSMYGRHKKALSKHIICEICTNAEASAEAFCRQCDKFACKNCVDMHLVMKAVFSGHECVSIEQLQKFRNEELVPHHPQPKNCSVHGEALKMFCFDCSKLICRDCTVKDHKDHNIEFNNIIADNKKKEFMKALEPLREIEKSLSHTLTKVSEAEKEIQGKQKEVNDAIEASFAEFQKLVERRKQQLLEENERIARDEICKLSMQKKKLSIAHGEVSNTISHTEQGLSLCSDDEITSMLNEMSDKIDKCCKRTFDAEVSDLPDIIVNIDCADALQVLLQQKATISTSTVAKQLELTRTPTAVEVHKEAKFTLCNKSDKKLFVGNLKCQARCISTGTLFTADIEEASSHRYDISSTLTERGRYEVEISANGYPVPGSPFALTVYACPTQLNESMTLWSEIVDPISIAINSLGEILVVENNETIIVFDREGIVVRALDIDDLSMDTLGGVAIDSNDNVYFVGLKSSQLGKCDRYLNNTQVQDVQQAQSSGHYDVEIVGEEVLVTERKNIGQITVYDKNLNFLRRISIGRETILRHLYPDSSGNIFVSTGDQNIIVLNMDGDILRFFGQDHSGDQILNSPWAVHVCGFYAYVADVKMKKLMVFTTEGKYICSFDHYGPVCVDKNGTVFSCDYFNNCVYIC